MFALRIVGPTTSGDRVSVVFPLEGTPQRGGTVLVRDAIGQRWEFPASSVAFVKEQP